jgi:hypothetical protein
VQEVVVVVDRSLAPVAVRVVEGVVVVLLFEVFIMLMICQRL